MPVIVLLADGVRPDTLAAALDDGALPALARLRDEGAMHTVTSCFPSVTGPAYTPFMMGRFPGPVGLPGLRWFDRARTATRWPDYTRSYVGYQMPALDRDLDPAAPTIFELVPRSLGALSVITRGLAPEQRVGGLSPRSVLRAATTHFTGNVRGWLQIDREVSAEVVRRVREERPDFVFAALTGVDKTSHAEGHGAPVVLDALTIVDETAAALRADAERAGTWDETNIWVTSDHGHSRVRWHEDLAGVVAELGHRVIAHPWVVAVAPDVAVMVSGNAMAHLYLEPARRERPYWPSLSARWESLADSLLARRSVDLLTVVLDERTAEVRSATRGRALVRAREDGTYDYLPTDGDPLGVGCTLSGVSADEAHDATIATEYPASIVQLARLATSPRAGEIVLSAARDWDFRSKYEPIPHVSSHGALHREHMFVPLLTNRPPRTRPRRTADVMPSALSALGVAVPAGLDGESFV